MFKAILKKIYSQHARLFIGTENGVEVASLLSAEDALREAAIAHFFENLLNALNDRGKAINLLSQMYRPLALSPVGERGLYDPRIVNTLEEACDLLLLTTALKWEMMYPEDMYDHSRENWA